MRCAESSKVRKQYVPLKGRSRFVGKCSRPINNNDSNSNNNNNL